MREVSSLHANAPASKFFFDLEILEFRVIVNETHLVIALLHQDDC